MVHIGETSGVWRGDFYNRSYPVLELDSIVFYLDSPRDKSIQFFSSRSSLMVESNLVMTAPGSTTRRVALA
jgi:hypothetical protein